MATVEAIIAPPQPVVAEPQEAKTTGHQFWAQYLRSIMEPLLQSVGSYTPEEQALHLHFLVDHVAASLGPLPTEPRGQYTMTYVDSPFEPSLNLTSAGKAKVRYEFEVVKPAGGCDGPDPFGEHRAQQLLPLLAKACGADTKWLNSLMDAFFLTDTETDLLRGKLPSFMPCCMMAFDLSATKTMMKVYIPGIRKAIASGSPSTNAFILNAVRKLEPFGEKLGPGLDLVAE
jgi:DMATS type aromatic prenyltransferase